MNYESGFLNVLAAAAFTNVMNYELWKCFLNVLAAIIMILVQLRFQWVDSRMSCPALCMPCGQLDFWHVPPAPAGIHLLGTANANLKEKSLYQALPEQSNWHHFLPRHFGLCPVNVCLTGTVCWFEVISVGTRCAYNILFDIKVDNPCFVWWGTVGDLLLQKLKASNIYIYIYMEIELKNHIW